MNCPSCQSAALATVDIEPDLHAQACSDCGGVWLNSAAYLRWRTSAEDRSDQDSRATAAGEVEEPSRAKLCPECGRILVRYRVSADLDFGLDHCDGCNGIWLDRNEWDHLRAHGLHSILNQVFTPSWQRRIREESHRRAMESQYLDRFGPEDYTEAKRVRQWLAEHRERTALLAYLSSPDPYSL